MREKSSELEAEAEYVIEKVSLRHQLASDDMSRSIPRLQGSLKSDFRKRHWTLDRTQGKHL